jgi:hypothetical protein
MADTKISALPPSTTPLAGTEVLPIVQSSTTKKVSVADLTTGRAISVSGLTVSGLTASTALALNASKEIVSVTNTGTGDNVLATSPTLVTPILGTPQSGVVTNLTGTASININGTVGATTATTGKFTTLEATGVATFSAGTDSAPAITTSGDTNTGIFFPAADTIAFTEGGAEAARFNSSGSFLVGTTASAGLVSNSRSVVAGGFRSLNGEFETLVSGTAYTMFTAPADFCTYLVNVHGGVSAVAYSETAIVQVNNGSIRVDIISAGANVVIDNSGTAIRVTQNSGGNMGFLVWSAVRMA